MRTPTVQTRTVMPRMDMPMAMIRGMPVRITAMMAMMTGTLARKAMPETAGMTRTDVMPMMLTETDRAAMRMHMILLMTKGLMTTMITQKTATMMMRMKTMIMKTIMKIPTMTDAAGRGKDGMRKRRMTMMNRES